MYRFLILLICLGGAVTAHAQSSLTYPEVEATTYRLYQGEQWDSLVLVGESALEAGFDFYYLYLRLGIAAFWEEEYLLAQRYLRAALDKNQGSDIARDYLYGTYLRLGQYGPAAVLYKRSGEALQALYPKPGRRPLDYFHLEVGLKPSSNPELAGTMQYAQVGLGHRLGGRVQLYQAYSYMTQQGSWGNFTQHQYYLGGSVYLGKGWSFMPAGQYIGLEGALSGSEVVSVSETTNRINLPPPMPRTRYDTLRLTLSQTATGNFSDQGGIAYLGLERQWGRWQVQAYGSAYLNRHQEAGVEAVAYLWETISHNVPGPDFYHSRDSASYHVLDQDSSYWQAQGGLSLTFTPRTRRDQLSLGLDLHLPWREGKARPSVSPRISWQASPRLRLLGSYYYGQVAQVIEQQGLILQNTTDVMNHRGLIMGQLSITPQVRASAIYMLEQRTAELSGQPYFLHGLFTGLTFIL
ncbi:MAG: hypothetical protein D6722_07115 [Bacteroidetes bacterium]|nr:MAG: hypothetical protein D6722_07115 [Bacteroidota bacterium]